MKITLEIPDAEVLTAFKEKVEEAITYEVCGEPNFDAMIDFIAQHAIGKGDADSRRQEVCAHAINKILVKFGIIKEPLNLWEHDFFDGVLLCNALSDDDSKYLSTHRRYYPLFMAIDDMLDDAGTVDDKLEKIKVGIAKVFDDVYKCTTSLEDMELSIKRASRRI